MTENHSQPECERIQLLLSEYVLGCAEAGDADSVRKHVLLCPPCRRELSSYRRVADALLVAPAPVAPSESLRRRVLAAAGIASPAIGRSPTRESIWSRAGRFLQTGGSLGRFGPALAAVAVAVALGFGYQAIQLQGELDRMRVVNSTLQSELNRQGQSISEVLQPGSIVWELRGTDSAPAAKAALYCNPDSQIGILATTDLPPLPESQIYQLWLIKDGRRTSGGLLEVDGLGKGVLTIRAPERFSAYQSVGVTVEPSGGSDGPTGPRVLAGLLY